MKFRQYLILYLVALLFFIFIGLFQTTPGYMDASYYYVTGQQLAIGKGAIEPFLWNYLNDPQQIPTAAFTYWMPVSAFLAAFGMWLLRSVSFLSARLFFFLFAAIIPVLTVIFASRYSANRVNLILAAIFSILCGAYLPYLTITETFLPFFILGAIYLLIVWAIFEKSDKRVESKWSFALLGIVTGLMHLTRADGILWLLGGLVLLFFQARKNKELTLVNLLFFLFGYLIIMAGWFIRNLVLLGTLFPSGSSLAVWFTSYNDLFMYPASELTPSHLWSAGLGKILKTRAIVGLLNLKNLVGVVANIVLLPFMCIGLWKTRKTHITKFVLFLVVMLFCLMTFVFPYAGFRGGFFHSMSAFQIFFWAIAIVGLDVTVQWSVVKLKWVESKSRILFAVALTLGIGAMSAIAYMQKIGLNKEWNVQSETFKTVDEELQMISDNNDFSVMVNDSPSYYAATGREAIQLSSGSPESIRVLMRRFGIKYLIINKDCPDSIKSMVDEPGDQFGFTFINQVVAGYYVYTQE